MTSIALASTDTPDEPNTKPPNDPTYGDVVATAHLLDPQTDDATVCKTIQRMYSDQRDKYARYTVESQVNLRSRGGECNLWVNKIQDRAQYEVYVPAGSMRLLDQFGNLVDQTCQQFVSQLTQDPAKPNAIPSTGEDEDRDSADFATKVLADACSESGLDANEKMKQAVDAACSFGSGWILAFTNPKGGGRQPIEVDAHPQAVHVDTAMQDPATGQDLNPQQTPPVRKYVGTDGSLSDNQGQAALRWVPKVEAQVVTGDHIRLWPATAVDVWDAEVLIYLDYQPVSVAKAWLNDVELTDEEWKKATSFRLTEAQHLLPKRNGRPYDPKPQGREEDWLVLVSCLWAPEGSVYPNGAYIACVGDQKVGVRSEWVLTQPDGTREKRDIPWTQVRQFRGTPEHPQGKGLVSFIRAGCEYLAEVFGRFADLSEKAANRKAFLPFASTIQPHELQDPSNAVLYVQPGYAVTYEQVPEPPRSLEKLIEMIRAAIKESSFIENGTGIDAPDANSGRQALAVVAQAHAGLSDVNQNINKAWVRFWRIVSQCIKADYSVPQLTRISGPDGGYKVKRWSNSDLGSTRDYEIAKGSGTMLNPVQKAQALAEARQLAGLEIEDVQEIMATGLSPYAPFQDNRPLQRIRRQVAEWEAGPPPGWAPPPPPPVDPLTGQPQAGPPTMGPDGLPVPGAPLPPPPDPVLVKLWRPVDSDMSPVAAKWRIRELLRAQQSARYMDLPPEWNVGLDLEFKRAQQALQPPPMPVQGVGKPPGADPSQPQLSPNEQAATNPLP